jgi:hypothetical protein
MKRTELLLLGVLMLVPGQAGAQEDPNFGPPAAPTGGSTWSFMGGDPDRAADPQGSSLGGTFVSPVKFTGRLSSTAPVLTYNSFHYYNSPGSASALRYFAQLDVPTGGLVNGMTCIFNDTSTTTDVGFSLQKYSTDFSVSPPTRTGTTLASGASSGNAGIGFQALSLTTPETISVFDGVWLVTSYHLALDVAGDTSFGGCWVWWRRQVKAAPATATFTDVPTTNGQFRFVEALVSSGVTSGCGGGNYCPDSPVTRGQMAVFLSVALGLNFPY